VINYALRQYDAHAARIETVTGRSSHEQWSS